jgi:hypothetical protein
VRLGVPVLVRPVVGRHRLGARPGLVGDVEPDGPADRATQLTGLEPYRHRDGLGSLERVSEAEGDEQQRVLADLDLVPLERRPEWSMVELRYGHGVDWL